MALGRLLSREIMYALEDLFKGEKKRIRKKEGKKTTGQDPGEAPWRRGRRGKRDHVITVWKQVQEKKPVLEVEKDADASQ